MGAKRTLAAVVVAAGLFGSAQACRADQIVVTNYGVTVGGWPYAVALAKGFFKEEGADITGILTSAGGGTTIRNILAANVPYGEVGPAIAIQANLQGANLKIISDNITSVADIAWVVKPDSPIKTLADLKGKKIGYTNPKSVSQGLSAFVIQAAGLKPNEAELVRTGGFGEGLAALDIGAVDTTPIPEPLLAQNVKKYRILARGIDVLPIMDNTVGVTTPAAAETKGDVIRAIIRARRRGIEFIATHPDEAIPIIAKHANLPEESVKISLQNVLAIKPNGVPYFGDGRIHLGGMKRIMAFQKEIGAMDQVIDPTQYIDYSYLPDALKAPAP
ncbi:ABC transporter substrate-binding protein [Terrarubrum flagellatum]|uniref:ABC transporter substrate-binding protein n=1 Tax=Terrirubrum flagellatum TaxID=2895980 RepID=UPI003144D38C